MKLKFVVGLVLMMHGCVYSSLPSLDPSKKFGRQQFKLSKPPQLVVTEVERPANPTPDTQKQEASFLPSIANKKVSVALYLATQAGDTEQVQHILQTNNNIPVSVLRKSLLFEYGHDHRSVAIKSQDQLIADRAIVTQMIKNYLSLRQCI